MGKNREERGGTGKNERGGERGSTQAQERKGENGEGVRTERVVRPEKEGDEKRRTWQSGEEQLRMVLAM